MNDAIHTFENDVRVYDRHLLDAQRERYKQRNVHEEDEEDLFLDIIRRLREHGTFGNVGSAIGYYAILAKLRRPDLRIHCFEPLPRHLDHLRENWALNGLSNDNLTLHPCAVAYARGRVRLLDQGFGSAVIEDDPDASVIALVRKSIKFRRVGFRFVKVDGISLLDACHRMGAEVDFLQMDIQGHEQRVVQQYFRELDGEISPVDTFLIGTHGKGIHTSCLRILSNNGYRIDHDEFETKHQPDGIVIASREPSLAPGPPATR